MPYPEYVPVLKNSQWERFALATARGAKRGEAHLEAGYTDGGKRANNQKGSALYNRDEVKARVAELENEIHEQAVEATGLSQAYVIEGLKDNIEVAKQAKPLFDSQGNETGEYKLDLPAANRAYELLGKHQGMFRDRLDIHNMDSELSGMSPEELRAYVRALATEIGLRVVDESLDQRRAYILRNAASVGLACVASSGEDPASPEEPQDGGVRPVSEAAGVLSTRH